MLIPRFFFQNKLNIAQRQVPGQRNPGSLLNKNIIMSKKYYIQLGLKYSAENIVACFTCHFDLLNQVPVDYFLL